MTKRILDIDDDLLAEATEILDTGTVEETINHALAEAIRVRVLRRHILQLSTMEGLDLDNDEVMARAWR